MNEYEKLIRKQIALEIMDESNPLIEFLTIEDGKIRVMMKICKEFSQSEFDKKINQDLLK